MNRICFILPAFLLLANQGFSQGCSDAGVCTIVNSVSESSSDDTLSKKLNTEIGLGFGIGDNAVMLGSIFSSLNWRLTDGFSLSTKITAQVANGDLGFAAGLGDVVVTGSYRLPHKQPSHTSVFLAGLKVPLNRANLSNDQVSLPMVYQSSLGTLDLILGYSLYIKRLFFQTGGQLPLAQFNKNDFIQLANAESEIGVYPSGRMLQRRPDIILRAGYKIKSNNAKWTFTPNAIGIYHLGEDVYVNELNNEIAIAGSSGLTLNLNVIANYAIRTHKAIEISLAAPVVVREIRPDGLTRALTLSVSYQF